MALPILPDNAISNNLHAIFVRKVALLFFAKYTSNVAGHHAETLLNSPNALASPKLQRKHPFFSTFREHCSHPLRSFSVTN
jgi:hypothetical protein